METIYRPYDRPVVVAYGGHVKDGPNKRSVSSLDASFHAAQRHAVLGARGELYIEHARADLGVLEQHFVEVAETKEQDRVGHLLLNAQVLCDQR